MRIVWFTWKDQKHPFAGGAEAVDREIAKQLVKDGHELLMISGGFKGGKQEEMLADGYKVIRVGNYFSVYFEAYKYYKKNLQGWADIVIEEINTIPFMTQWYVKEKRILLVYQLCRIVWFYQLFFPLNIIGYLLEPIYLWLLRNNTVLTESESTKKDFLNYGFNAKKIHVFPVSIEIKPLESIEQKKTFNKFTILSLGSIRSMKRTLHQIKAFEIAKQKLPQIQMKIAGTFVGSYGQKCIDYIKKSPYAADIEYLGSISNTEKKELMKKSHLILVTSVKEGWGLIVTEAGSQGTPAIVYNVDGLRDSVVHNKTGLITEENTAQVMANNIISLYNNKKQYQTFQKNTLEHSKKFTHSNSYKTFTKFILKQS